MNRAQLLTSLNLSPSEAKTYLAVLEGGGLKKSEIWKLISTTRMAGYLAVDALIKKGLLAEVTKEGKRLVVAEDPERLWLRLEESKNKLKDQEEQLKLLVPELEVLYHSIGSKPSVKVYEGVEGLKSVYEDTLRTMKQGSSYVAFGAVDEAFGLLGDYLEDYVARRIQKSISFRGIAPADSLASDFIREDPIKLRSVRLVPKEKFPFVNEIDIYANKVAILSFRDKIGLLIESKQIADTQKAIFELAWEGAEKYNHG